MKLKYVFLVATILLPISVMADDFKIHLAKSIAYKDVDMIQDNILSECVTVGSDLSASIAKTLEAEGYQVSRVDVLDTSIGNVLDVTITSVVSEGNAFMGHHKNVTAILNSYKDGQKIATKKFTRNTMGGFAGGFKGSCSVLNRAVVVVGSDIGQWYKANAK